MFPQKQTLLASALVLIVMAGCAPKEEPKTEASSTTQKSEPVKPTTPETKPTETPQVKPDAPKEETVKPKGEKLHYITTPSGLKYAVITEGKGEKLQRGQVALVNYRGTFEDGREFDKSKEPYPTPVGVRAVIAGWDEALLTMRVGDKRKLIVPGDLAYPEGRDGIAPNTTLLFDIEVAGIRKD